MSLNHLIESISPPVLVQLAKQLGASLRSDTCGLSGNYRSWDEAISASTGYDSENILEKTRQALLKVKNGEAVYERDSVLFDEIQYTWPLLAGLMWVAARHEGKLNVLDFGGSLGSTYFQNRYFLSSLPQVRWNIVEQPHYVETGKRWFEDDRLCFYVGIADCVAETQPNVALLSSVLQYLEQPYSTLAQILTLPFDCIIIDRTPFWAGSADRLCIQTVPDHIYPASYPSWIFSRSKFHANISENWQIMTTFDNPDNLPGPIDFVYQGEIIARRNDLP